MKDIYLIKVKYVLFKNIYKVLLINSKRGMLVDLNLMFINIKKKYGILWWVDLLVF